MKRVLLLTMLLSFAPSTARAASAMACPQERRALILMPLNDPHGGSAAGGEWSELLHRRLKLVSFLPIVPMAKVRRALDRRKRFAFTFTPKEWKDFARSLNATHVLRGQVRVVDDAKIPTILLRLRLFRAGRDLPLYDREAEFPFEDDPGKAICRCCDTLVGEMIRSMRMLIGAPPSMARPAPENADLEAKAPAPSKEKRDIVPPPPRPRQRMQLLPLPTEHALIGSRLRKAPHALPPRPEPIPARREGPRATIGLQRWKPNSDGIGSLPFKTSTETRSGLLLPLRKEGSRMALERSSATDGSAQVGESFQLDLDFLDLTFEQDLGLGGLYLGLGASHVSGSLNYDLGGLSVARKTSVVVPRLVAGLRIHDGHDLTLDLQVPMAVGEIDFGASAGAAYCLDLERPHVALRLAKRF